MRVENMRKRKKEKQTAKNATEASEEPPVLEGFSLRAPKFKVNVDERDELELSSKGKIAVLFCFVLFGAVYVYLLKFSPFFSGMIPVFQAGASWGFYAEDLVDMTGQTIVVSGASSGIGNATIRVLLARNATVILGCKNVAKCQKNVETIRRVVPHGISKIVDLDLASLESILSFTDSLSSTRVDGLVLSAGFVPRSFRMCESVEVEESFFVNYLSQFALTNLLIGNLLQSPNGGKVVVVSSFAHHYPWKTTSGVPLTLDEANDSANFDSLRTYGMTSLAKVLFVRELDRRYHSRGLISTAVNPGFVDTHLLPTLVADGKTIDSFAEPLFRLLLVLQDYISWNPMMASLSVVAAIVKPVGHGLYTNPIARPFPSSFQGQNATAAEQLWNLSQDIFRGFKLEL